MLPTYILYLIDDLNVGGAEQSLASLVKALNKEKFYPIVCSIEKGEIYKRLIKEGIEVVLLQKTRPYDIVLLRSLISIIKTRKIDILHSHLLISNIYGWLAAKLIGVPSIISVHGSNLLKLKHGRKIFGFVAKHSEKVITVSNSLREDIKRELGLRMSNSITIHNGVDLERFKCIESDGSLRKELRLEEEDLVVGSVGRLHPVKDHISIIKAARLVKQRFPRAKFLIVGNGPLRENLKFRVQSLKLEKDVLFLGQRDDIPKVIKAFDIFVCSSLTEGISYALIEAMAVELPIVATDVGGNSNVINKETGILIPPRSPERLADAIIYLIKNPELRTKMGKAGRRRVEEKFSLDRMVDEYEKLYEKCLAERGLR